MSQTKNPGSSNFLDDRTLTLNFESKLMRVARRPHCSGSPRRSWPKLSLNVTESILIFNVTFATRSLSTRVNSPGYPHVS